MVRTLFRTIAIGLFISGSTAGIGQAAENDCKISKDGKDGDNAVVQACKAGGIKRAKAVMKAMNKLAKEKGMKIKGAAPDCDSCHKNEEDWVLTDNAKEDFKKMIELTKEASK